MHISQGFSITFYHITLLLSEDHIDYYTCANLFNYPAILHLSKCSNRHLKLLPAQKSHKYTTPKPQKRIFEVATSVCITEHSIAFYYITSLFSEKHIECHACANLFNYPAILHLFKCSNRHLKLLPAQKSRKYTTPKLHLKYSFLCIKFYYLMNLHYSKTTIVLQRCM